MQLAAFLCVICVICGRIYIQTYSINIHKRNPSVSRRSRRLRRQNPKQQNSLTSRNCLSLRYNAACCIRLRHLRYLRENNTQEDSIYIAQMKPKKSPADLADLRRQTTKQQNSLTTQICLSLRDNAACCVPLRHLRYLRENKHASVLNQSTQKKPQCLPLTPQIYADKQQNPKTALASNKLSFSA